jgi:multiple sugar transport system substrate-binding protein
MQKKLTLFMMTGLLIVGLVCNAGSGLAGKLIINSDTSDPAPKAAFTAMVEEFKKANPDIETTLNIYDHESYKTTIRNWLSTEAPDVIFWYSGERMRTFVSRGLIEPISDIWDAENLHEMMASTRAGVTFDGMQYGVPYSYYQWGVYYRKDIFEKHGLAVPKTWDEFKNVCATLKKNGIAPITIGTKFLWTAGGWFDYLNLRINGLDFHMQLMAGDAAYTDDRVKKVFAVWRELIDPGYYVENHTSYSWQEAQAFMYQGKTAMYLIGNFIVPMFPDEVKDNMDFFQFPKINPDIPFYEDAPTDLIAIPSRAKNKADAKKFLSFISQPEKISKINDALNYLPTHQQSAVKDDHYLKIGNEMLKSSAGTAQFYDRDTKPEMAKIGMKGFQEFMDKPDRLDKILKRLEKARKRLFKKK